MSWHVSSPSLSSIVMVPNINMTRPQAEDEDAAEAELARQLASSQQQRYAGEQPAGAHPFSLA